MCNIYIVYIYIYKGTEIHIYILSYIKSSIIKITIYTATMTV